MDPALVSAATPVPLTFQDGLGERHLVVDRGRNEPVEMLCLRGELTSGPSFEFALRERVSRMAAFRHTCYAHVRTVERLKASGSTLALVSDATFVGSCAAGQPLSQDDADLVTQRIFPGDFAGLTYDARTCTMVPADGDDADAAPGPDGGAD